VLFIIAILAFARLIAAWIIHFLALLHSKPFSVKVDGSAVKWHTGKQHQRRGTRRRLWNIMFSAFRYEYRIIIDTVYQPVFFVDSPTPETFQLVFQRLGFSDALVAVPFYVPEKFIDFPSKSAVMFHPVTIVFPCGV
jgi:hypothetical protein